MKLKIFHSVNAGLYLWDGKSGLLIDFLHGGKELGFSDTKYADAMRNKQFYFRHSNDLLFTHFHGDHYDEKLVNEFLERTPGACLFGPGKHTENVNPVFLDEGVLEVQIQDYKIICFSTIHDGKQYEDVPHYSYLIQNGGDSVWVSGDASLDESVAEKMLPYNQGKAPDAAFFIVYQIGCEAGRGFLKYLTESTLFLYHLPYKSDDVYRFRIMGERLLKRCEKIGCKVNILKHDDFIY